MNDVRALHPKARKELDDLKADLFRRVRFHVLSASEASAVFYKKVREVIGQGAMVEASSDDGVLVECRFCDRKYAVKRKVLTFRCHCSPIEQFAQMQQVSLP